MSSRSPALAARRLPLLTPGQTRLSRPVFARNPPHVVFRSLPSITGTAGRRRKSGARMLGWQGDIPGKTRHPPIEARARAVRTVPERVREWKPRMSARHTSQKFTVSRMLV